MNRGPRRVRSAGVNVGDKARDNGASAVVYRGGRPRDPSRDAAIKEAALRVLADVGFHRLTMDAVAAAAGVGKATIYRRWRRKEDLLVSLIDEASDEFLAVPDTGSLRGDLRILLTSLAEVLAGSGGRASRALLGVLDREPALSEAFERGPKARWAQAFADVFDRAVQRGEVGPEAGCSLAAEAGPSILIQRWLVTGEDIGPDLVTAVVDEVMMPLLDQRGR